MGTNIVAFFNVIATYIALKLMDTTSRRTLLLISCGGMLLSTCLIITSMGGYIWKQTSVIAIMLFVSFFEIGLGPVTWLIVTEMFDSKYIGTAMSISCVINWICTFVIGILFPLLQSWLTDFSFVPFAIVLGLTYIFVYFELPETVGRTVEEIHDYVYQQSLNHGAGIHMQKPALSELVELGTTTNTNGYNKNGIIKGRGSSTSHLYDDNDNINHKYVEIVDSKGNQNLVYTVETYDIPVV